MDHKENGIYKLDAESVKLNMKQNESFNYGKNAPPDYDKIMDNNVPPSSNNFYKSIIYVKETGRGSYRVLKKLATLFFCSLTITVILIILMAIPITMIIIGSFFIKSCPMEKMIPIWLIVFGALAIIKNLSTLIQRIKYLKISADEQHHTSSTLLNVFDSFMALFLLIWFVCGNIWTYTNFNRVQSYDKTNTATYCNELTYYFSFWIITSIYILVCMACFIFCCTVCFTIFIPTKK